MNRAFSVDPRQAPSGEYSLDIAVFQGALHDSERAIGLSRLLGPKAWLVDGPGLVQKPFALFDKMMELLSSSLRERLSGWAPEDAGDWRVGVIIEQLSQQEA